MRDIDSSSAEVGSSPRVRGKPHKRVLAHFVVRLIPARAGKTFLGINRRAQLSAHPRACGENVGHVVQSLGGVGSSPRVRGKL